MELGAWLTAIGQAVRQRRWGWAAVLPLASLLLAVGAALVWFPLFLVFLCAGRRTGT